MNRLRFFHFIYSCLLSISLKTKLPILLLAKLRIFCDIIPIRDEKIFLCYCRSMENPLLHSHFRLIEIEISLCHFYIIMMTVYIFDALLLQSSDVHFAGC